MKTVDQFLSHWKETTSFMPKMHNMDLIMRKPQEKKKTIKVIFCKITCLYFSKMSGS